ncbi:SurA N-terminal domain-containing protein [bacterium]|nr:SurA N-terminal domain-containing protein [bacterium]
MVKYLPLLFALVLLGCDVPETPADHEKALTNRVIATVNGVPLMSETLELYIANWGEEYEKHNPPVTYELLKKMRAQKLEQMINEELVKQRIKESPVAISDEEIKAHISKMIDDLGGSDQFINYLQERGYVTLEELEEDVKADLEALKVFTRDMRLVPPTEEQLKETYELLKDHMILPERLWLSHIQVSLDKRLLPDGSKEVYADEYLNYIKDQIDHKYITFAKAAREYSECRSSQHDGMVGELRKWDTNSVPKIIHDTAFSLAVSNTSGVVVSPLGAHLLYVTRKAPAYTNSFEESRTALTEFLIKQVLDQNRDNWLLFLRNRADIHYVEIP